MQKKRVETKQIAQQERKKLKLSKSNSTSTESGENLSAEVIRPKEKEKKKVTLEKTSVSAPKSILRIRKCEPQDSDDNSVENGRNFFNWLIKPIDGQNFFK